MNTEQAEDAERAKLMNIIDFYSDSMNFVIKLTSALKVNCTEL